MTPLRADRSAPTGAYGLSRPAPAEIRLSLHRIFGEDAEAVFGELLTAAGLGGPHDLTDDEVTRLVDHMAAHADGAVRLCAQSFLIRLRSFQHLSAAHQIVRNAS